MSTPQERLIGGFYNSAAWSGANPGGLANGGHVQNFPAALEDIGAVAQDVGLKAAQTIGAANAAGASAASAANDRQLAQQAAIAAALFDPAAFARKTGDRFDGIVTVGPAAFGSVNLIPGTTAANGGYIEFMMGGARQAYIGNATDALVFAVAEGGRSWSFEGPVLVQGFRPYTAANDGSGSGVDADMVRGVIPHHEAQPSTLVTRDNNGFAHVLGISIQPGGFERIYFAGNDRSILRDGDNLKINCSLYLDGTLSAADITHRSDRSLKRDITSVAFSNGRLRPVSFTFRETGEQRMGFIAQEVAEVRPEAVRANDKGVLEIDTVALIAELAHQLNRALDRLQALEGRHDVA